jgi:hypothetical protein
MKRSWSELVREQGRGIMTQLEEPMLKYLPDAGRWSGANSHVCRSLVRLSDMARLPCARQQKDA